MSQQQKPVISTSFSYETLEETLDIKPKGVPLHIGIPRETAFQENRIALTPDAVGVLVSNGHDVVIEHNAGEAAHYRDRDYSEAGARIMYDKSEVLKAPILVKSAPVMEEDLPMLHLNQIIISPIHLSAMKAELLQKMMDKRITGISFENLKDDSGTYPIVRSMSEIAGSAVMLVAGQYLSSANHGKGVLLGGISGIPPTKVIILGAGIVGEFAAGAGRFRQGLRQQCLPPQKTSKQYWPADVDLGDRTAHSGQADQDLRDSRRGPLFSKWQDTRRRHRRNGQ
jgi:alanine dehydrogenase